MYMYVYVYFELGHRTFLLQSNVCIHHNYTKDIIIFVSNTLSFVIHAFRDIHKLVYLNFPKVAPASIRRTVDLIHSEIKR